jgi:hypothetical protein
VEISVVVGGPMSQPFVHRNEAWILGVGAARVRRGDRATGKDPVGSVPAYW